MRGMARYIRTSLIGGVILLAVFAASLMWLPSVLAVQYGPADQVTLNPGGGLQTNGSDGIRFTINSDTASGNPNYAYAGADAIVHRNTYQYCCGAGGPMLNIGGTLFGQASAAASGAQAWSSIELLSLSGVAVEGTRTASTGNSGATLRYTAQHGGRTYTMTRTVTYIYPNDYVTDSYTFVIPEGNTDTVKFYLGGDTAPGSSDSGYGIMLTSPVRSVISLNTSSRIMFGLREVSGSKPFDGATSQHYSAPYTTVRSGGDLGYVVTASTHDAGLMMQWNLGSTPGTQTAVMQQFATRQGTNLNAAFATNTTDVDVPVTFSASIVNTELTTVSGLGYTLTLPSGLVIGNGSQSNTCSGTVVADAGSSSVVLSGGSVAGGSNCVVTIPVVAAAAGTYGISGSSFTDLVGALENNVGASSLTVSNPELGSDLNGDGVSDADQTNLYSYTSPVTSKTVVLEVDEACSINSATSIVPGESVIEDEGYEYVNGLMDFTLSCGTPGYTTTIQQYYYDVLKDDLVLRKYNPNTGIYSTIDDAALEQVVVNDNTVTRVTYQVTDGGELDTDGLANGTIVDPAGLAGPAGSGAGGEPETTPQTVAAPNTGLGMAPTALFGAAILAGIALATALAAFLYRRLAITHEDA